VSVCTPACSSGNAGPPPEHLHLHFRFAVQLEHAGTLSLTLSVKGIWGPAGQLIFASVRAWRVCLLASGRCQESCRGMQMCGCITVSSLGVCVLTSCFPTSHAHPCTAAHELACAQRRACPQQACIRRTHMSRQRHVCVTMSVPHHVPTQACSREECSTDLHKLVQPLNIQCVYFHLPHHFAGAQPRDLRHRCHCTFAHCMRHCSSFLTYFL